jgi:ribonuclease P protein subunit POP4
LSAEGIQSKILKSDLTGSILLIIASRNPSLIGIKGIVIEETASTVRLISRDDIIRIIPKNGTQFQLSFPAYAPPPMTEDQRRDVERGEPEPAVDWEEHARSCPRVQLDILGTSFGYRSADRAGRKFRPAQGGGGGSGWGEEWVRGEWSGVLEGVEQEMEARKCPTTKLAQGKVSERASRKGNGRKAGSGQGASESGHDANGDKKRKRGKSRRKDLPQWGRLDVP